VYQKNFPLKHLIKVLQTGLIATNVLPVRCRRRCIALSFVWKDTKKRPAFLSPWYNIAYALYRLLGTGGISYQSVSRLSGMGEKALWQNLVVELALCVLPMCLEAKGRIRLLSLPISLVLLANLHNQ